MPLTIAIDGPVGAGKSTISARVAKALNILHLDTGAMYRAVGYFALSNGVNTLDQKAVSTLLLDLNISVQYLDGAQRTYVNGLDVSDLIRTPQVSMATSNISKWPEVRKTMVDLQRKLAKDQSILLDGRDIGSVVLPDADVKIYLTASPQERARRRHTEMVLKGETDTYEEVLKALLARDEQDMNREIDPLKVAQGAIIVDTTHLSFDETVEKILAIVEEVK